MSYGNNSYKGLIHIFFSKHPSPMWAFASSTISRFGFVTSFFFRGGGVNPSLNPLLSGGPTNDDEHEWWTDKWKVKTSMPYPGFEPGTSSSAVRYRTDWANEVGLYNLLPKHIKEVTSYNIFKTKLVQFLLDKRYYTVSEYLTDKKQYCIQIIN